MLEARHHLSESGNIFQWFNRQCALAYNSFVPAVYPPMHSLIQGLGEGSPHTLWILHHDLTCETEREPL